MTLTMDQEAFWRLGFGRVAPVRVARPPARSGSTGDVALGHRVLDAMAFMI